MMRARCHEEEGCYAAAKDDLNAALHNDPACASLRMQRSKLFSKCRQYEDAFFELQHLLSIDPEYAGLLEHMQKAAASCQMQGNVRGDVSVSKILDYMKCAPTMN